MDPMKEIEHERRNAKEDAERDVARQRRATQKHVANIFVQAGLLAVALLSLADTANLIPPAVTSTTTSPKPMGALSDLDNGAGTWHCQVALAGIRRASDQHLSIPVGVLLPRPRPLRMIS